jgi:hypothetical protein
VWLDCCLPAATATQHQPRTKHRFTQAKHFANWFEGQGEQDCSIWMEENAKVNAVNVDMDKYAKQGGFTANENKEIIVPVTIYK